MLKSGESRIEALQALERFLPQVPAYAARRGFVTSGASSVSRLSPFIRRRIISEQEVVQRVLKEYPLSIGEKFVQEVVWRTYWKGWLERYPGVWSDCLGAESAQLVQSDRSTWWTVYLQACGGQTDLDFFNDWVAELRASGYLHNHVRMWFASIWIFTLKIPWQLGAMFMYRHLLDGDPASNTLSWRWVAGLQTKGKTYLVRPDNIATYSNNRWRPNPSEVAAEIAPEVRGHLALQMGVVHRASIRETQNEIPTCRFGVITTDEDLSIETEGRLYDSAAEVLILAARASCGESDLVTGYISRLQIDAAVRLGSKGKVVNGEAECLKWAKERSFDRLVIVLPAVGPNTVTVEALIQVLERSGVRAIPYRRKWDIELHKLADRGFFPFWERVKRRIQAGEVLT